MLLVLEIWRYIFLALTHQCYEQTIPHVARTAIAASFNIPPYAGTSLGPGSTLNSLRPRQNGRHFADNVFKCIVLNENVWISLKISLKFVPKGLINNLPSLVQIMAWRRPGGKPLSEPRMESLLMHICVTRSQWVNTLSLSINIKLHLCEGKYLCSDYCFYK